jgi:transposase InsO family protein
MDYHKNARLVVHSREQLARLVIEQGQTQKAAASAFHVSEKTAAKWTRRYRQQGAAGLPKYLHVAIDDHSRIAFSAILADQTHQSAMRFFLMARAHFNRFGFSIRRVLTDNGSCYKDGRFRQLLNQQHVKHRFTRPYTPRTNGKAERFIQTSLRE